MSGIHERVICPHGAIIKTCRCMEAAKHTRVEACPWPDLHVGQPVTAGWTVDGTQIVASGPGWTIGGEVQTAEVVSVAEEPRGVWLAHHRDNSDFAVFESELEAYRHAAGLTMHVVFLPFGTSVLELP